LGQAGALQPGVVANHDLARLNFIRISAADAPGQVFIELIGDATANIVRFETLELH
jgi:hypothetical protein